MEAVRMRSYEGLRIGKVLPIYLIFLLLLGSCESKSPQESSPLLKTSHKLQADCDTQSENIADNIRLDKNKNKDKDKGKNEADTEDVVDLLDGANTGCSLNDSHL